MSDRKQRDGRLKRVFKEQVSEARVDAEKRADDFINTKRDELDREIAQLSDAVSLEQFVALARAKRQRKNSDLLGLQGIAIAEHHVRKTSNDGLTVFESALSGDAIARIKAFTEKEIGLTDFLLRIEREKLVIRDEKLVRKAVKREFLKRSKMQRNGPRWSNEEFEQFVRDSQENEKKALEEYRRTMDKFRSDLLEHRYKDVSGFGRYVASLAVAVMPRVVFLCHRSSRTSYLRGR